MLCFCLEKWLLHGVGWSCCALFLAAFGSLQALGVPTVESWPGLAQLPHRIDFKPAPGLPLKQVFPAVSGPVEW